MKSQNKEPGKAKKSKGPNREMSLAFGFMAVSMNAGLLVNEFREHGWLLVANEVLFSLPIAVACVMMTRYYHLSQTKTSLAASSPSPDLGERTPTAASIEVVSTPIESIEGTGNLQTAIRVRDRYWNPDRFDIASRDTYPTQKDIIEWIKQERPGISDALARAIEKVACPIDR